MILELAGLAPQGERRMGANPHANGESLLRDLIMPDFRDYAVDVPSPGSVHAADAHEPGVFLRDVVKLNSEQRNFRIFGPDETLSNRLSARSRSRERNMRTRLSALLENLCRIQRSWEMALQGSRSASRSLSASSRGTRFRKCRQVFMPPLWIGRVAAASRQSYDWETIAPTLVKKIVQTKIPS